MARAGLYKSQVKKARDMLVAQGKHPSVDAIRIALGNTGSKTTIHKYLKELEEDEGVVPGRQINLSAEIQGLVSHLAAQLQAEAEATIGRVLADSTEKEQRSAQALTAANQEIERLVKDLQYCKQAHDEEKSAHAETLAALHNETIVRHTLTQEVTDLKDRLAENETHRQSLEEKHQHARDGLEHYRESVKEQREQDQRRYEQQIQHLQAELRQLQQTMVVKQDEITRLNQDKTRLISDLSYTQESLRQQQAESRGFEQKALELERTEQRSKALESQIAGKDAQVADLTTRLSESSKQLENLNAQVRSLELELTTAHAKLEVQQTNWDGFMKAVRVTNVPDDFMADRGDEPPQKRDFP